jgi:tetratricopeptide (TPR) repeat protein
LGRVFENYHPVFLGYAGNDKSLMDFLLATCQKFENNKWKFPYWMLYKSDPLDGQIKTFLDNSNGYYIKHNGFDDVMILLSSKFNHNIPKREDFLLDAEHQYVKLEEAIADFTDRTNRANIVKNIPVDPDKTDKSATITIEQGSDNKDTNDALASITSNSVSQSKYHESTVLIHQEKYSEAINKLKELITEDPSNPRYHSKLGEAYLRLGILEKACEEELIAINLDPNTVSAYSTLGKIYQQQGDLESALSNYLIAAALDPENELAHYNVGEIYESLEQYNSALAAYNEAANANPEWALPHLAIGDILAKIGRSNEALVEYEAAISIEPDWDLPYFLTGEIFEQMGKKSEALEYFLKTVNLNPDWSLGHYAVANTLTTLANYKEALQSITIAINLDPDQPHYHLLLALIHQKLGNKKSAQAAKQKADELRKLSQSDEST